ncbi:hypothetical protein, partial [Pseudomonas citrulli]
ARDGGGSACIDAGCANAIAGKPCSHMTVWVFLNHRSPQILWELSLLAMAVGQLVLMLDVPMPSRASLAPT